VDPEDDALTAAFAYGKVGLYLAPVRRGQYKNPGSVLGQGWPSKTFKDPESIAAAFAGTDHGIAIHLGRSGLVCFDVDDPEKMPPVLAAALDRDRPPKQRSRRGGDPRKGHYVFRMPAGRSIGNGLGKLGGGWGDVRGKNGVIVVAPSVHEKAADGGFYYWERTGPVPELPAELADALTDASGDADAATDVEVTEFLAQYTGSAAKFWLNKRLEYLAKSYAEGCSRHTFTVAFTTGAMEEARAGYFPAQDAADRLRDAFVTAMKVTRPGSDRKLDAKAAKVEFAGILAWAIGRAKVVDLDKIHERIEKAKGEPLVPGMDRPAPAGDPSDPQTDEWMAAPTVDATQTVNPNLPVLETVCAADIVERRVV
jgi:hypothetical protein